VRASNCRTSGIEYKYPGPGRVVRANQRRQECACARTISVFEASAIGSPDRAPRCASDNRMTNND
jgi:hypothetical protein